MDLESICKLKVLLDNIALMIAPYAEDVHFSDARTPPPPCPSGAGQGSLCGRHNHNLTLPGCPAPSPALTDVTTPYICHNRPAVLQQGAEAHPPSIELKAQHPSHSTQHTTVPGMQTPYGLPRFCTRQKTAHPNKQNSLTANDQAHSKAHSMQP